MSAQRLNAPEEAGASGSLGKAGGRVPAQAASKAKPRYSEVADQIRLEIVTGRYPVGTLLPSETELQQRFSVSRHTVRAATQQLQVNGMISPEHGRGYRVNSAKPVSRGSIAFGTLENVERYGRVTHLVNVRFTPMQANDEVALRLHCKAGEEVLQMQSYRVPRDASLASAIAWNETYFLGRFSSIIGEVEAWPGAIYSLIEERFGERVVSIRQEATAVNLDAVTARRLDVKAGTAGLQVRRSYVNAAGQMLMHATNTYVGSAFTLTMDINS